MSKLPQKNPCSIHRRVAQSLDLFAEPRRSIGEDALQRGDPLFQPRDLVRRLLGAIARAFGQELEATRQEDAALEQWSARRR